MESNRITVSGFFISAFFVLHKKNPNEFYSVQSFYEAFNHRSITPIIISKEECAEILERLSIAFILRKSNDSIAKYRLCHHFLEGNRTSLINV